MRYFSTEYGRRGRTVHYFDGQKLGSDVEFWSTIGRFCSGTLTFKGEDRNWGWDFNVGTEPLLLKKQWVVDRENIGTVDPFLDWRTE